MTKQARLEQVISEAVKPYLIMGLYSGFETDILEALAKEGVVRQVERKLPLVSEVDVIEWNDATRDGIKTGQQFMVDASYKATTPLVEK